MPVTSIKSKWEGGDLVFTDNDDNEVARFDSSTQRFRRQNLMESLTASTTLTQADYDECTLVLNAAAGLTVTLPVATGSGARFRFIVGTSVTSNAYIIKVADATDVMDGVVLAADDTGTPAPLVWVTAADSDTINLDGSTQGGIIGDWIELEDIGANQWHVHGFLKQSGTEATPFDATVS